jgi:non-specific serine/threonine protein kinase/serine/threonine-protein kinase
MTGEHMAETDQQRLRRVFELVIAAPRNGRDAILDRECGDDLLLRRRIAAMIAGAEDDHFLAAPTADSAVTVGVDTESAHPLAERPGTHIGPYKLLQLIGEGGFGSVFMAEQASPVSRKVALKVVKLGMDTKQVVARFEQERQALAIMDHPNIAKVFDAGVTPTGRPYFVMELCGGEPITRYCDKHNLTIDERLWLFVQVCQAVQHAHRKGVIHRDIKPTNVLVATQDGKPHAKVIDFGIAKATASKLTEKTLFTEHRQLIGTPEYMSPEQAEGSLDVDTRTDVYSLGVLLYELLTGATPFDAGTLRSAAYGEIQRIIREVDPPRPSTRLQQSSDTLAGVAARRQLEPRRLATLVRGELDWIVMKSLDKDRRRRYESPGEFASDIARYLSHEAVLAAPPSRAYRLRKFLGRNKSLVTTLTAVGLALLVGVVGFAWQARRAAVERDNAVAARNAEADAKELARQNEQVALTVNAFLADQVLARANPDRTDQGQVVTLREAIDLAANSLEGLFLNEPVIRATIHESLGQAYRGMGDWKNAERQFRAAYDRRLSARGPDDDATLKSMHSLATVLRITGDERAEPMLRDLVNRRLRVSGRDDVQTCSAQTALAMMLLTQRRFDEAMPLLEAAYAGQVKAKGETNIEAIQTQGAIVFAYNGLRQYDKAAQLGEANLRLCTTTLGDDHPETTRAKGVLGGIYGRQQRIPEAIEMFRQTDESEKKRLGEDHPNRLGTATDLAGALAQGGRFDEAIKLFEDCIRVGGASPRVDAGFMSNMKAKYVATLVLAKRYEDAERLMLEVYPGLLSQYGPRNYRTQNAVNTMVKLYERWGEKPAELARWRALVIPPGTAPSSRPATRPAVAG